MAGNLSEEDNFGTKNILDNPRIQIVAVGLLFFGLFLLAVGFGLFFFDRQESGSGEIQIISAMDEEVSGEIVVHVDGAVDKPGVYKLPGASRVNDAIVAAGGLTDDADRTRLNLAAKATDGQKIFIAKVGEASIGSSEDVAGESTGFVSINNSSQSELEALPRIGPVTAGKIIGGRPYNSIEELLTKKVVGQSVYNEIKNLVTY